MIKFISKKKHNIVEVEEELLILKEITQNEINFVEQLEIVGLDLETNNLDPYLGEILLLIIGDNNNQLVIDFTSIDCSKILSIIIDKLILGANIKFDYKFIRVKCNIKLKRMFDVMIAEQRITQGMTEISPKTNQRVQISSSLESIVKRRLRLMPTAMDKSIRNEFIGANPNNFVFENKHIYYGAGDIKYLFDIRIIQKSIIKDLNLGFLIYNIEFPLIGVLAEAELKGFNLNEDMWRQNIKSNKEKAFSTELELDNETKKLRALLPIEEQKLISGGKYDRVRVKKQEVEVLNLFGEDFENIEINPTGKTKKTQKAKSPYINYSSTNQVVSLMGRLKQLVPTKDNKTKQSGVPSIPTINIFKGKEIISKDNIYPYSYTTAAPDLETFVIENPKVPCNKFYELLINLRSYETKINTFGEEFIRKYKNRVTGRFHTIYRQCHAVTSRLQSGDKDNGWYNSHNLPREKEYREPFYDDGNWIITTDLSGAEAVIMIDKAKDVKFYEMAIVNDDAHSPLAQAVWRGIGKARLEKFALQDSYDEEKYQEALKLSNIVISKKENKDIRTAYKNMTFGDIYGMGIKKRAKTLGVSEEEAILAGNIQKSMIPKTYKMIEANAKFASTYGYIILNNRTNSRMWYSEVLECLANNTKLPSNTKHEIESSARNAPIQSTQADMVKEIMVEIHNECVRQDLYNRYNIGLLKQVHDETVYTVDKSVDIYTTFVEFLKDNNGVEMVTIPEFIKKWHTQVCNRYLSFITMSAEQNIAKTWTK